ncbi:hypothetical protein B0I35DRAFT_39696 [Stachybotrys elegans]|uniref:Phosphodiesterase n=1 Tax=Stachybotrys elegans TaxID=80388 RepID=A0A8K0WX07_9HYPO|nr:hypothetical protein B0I35DRAFT_39696 [Stachybotrys elegans]
MDRHTMERHACHVIYVNRDVGEDRVVRSVLSAALGSSDQGLNGHAHDALREDIQPLLDAFGDVHVCATGLSCISKLLELQDESMTDMRPMIVLLDTPDDVLIPDSRRLSRSPSPCSPNIHTTASAADIHTPEEDIYGLDLLQKLITEARMRSMSKLVVPVPLIRSQASSSMRAKQQMTDGAVEPFTAPLGTLDAHRRLVRRCLDLGAVDVIISPLDSNCITALEICAYKAHRDASREQQDLMEIRRGRKRSWVGVNEEKPFAYLREAMVSNLMNGICRLSPEEEQITSFHIAVSTERQNAIAAAVGKWHFDAHSFTDDELLVAAMAMFKHALAMPELEAWRLHTDQLITFLVACRAAYNSFVPYHNFRHVIDVLQATFNFLVHVDALPPYPSGRYTIPSDKKSPIAALLSPFEALTLLITAIGHDVGHPGVNNGFLSTLNAPLAQLYNDRSVLESFHCAAYTQILRRYWPAAFEDRKMRSLMISSILATDMGLHFDYMKKMGDLQEKLQDNNTTDGWNGRLVEEQKALACSLLIKCADISNVVCARHFDTAVQWMHILSEEFSRQASMEEELEIKSSLLAPPKKDLLSLVNAQLGFMNMFAMPLFQGVADIMPGMQYTVDELEINKGRFEIMVQHEKTKALKEDPQFRKIRKEGTYSPRTMSFAVDPSNAVSRNPSFAVLDHSGPSLSIPGQNHGSDPSVVLDVKRAEEHLEESDLSQTTVEYKEVNGTISSFEAVREFAESDPFFSNDHMDDHADSKSVPYSGQRRSETTEGSTSGGLAGDWASQATSATTGKMPISPSTRGTSIVSRESMEHNGNIPGLSVERPSTDGSPATVKREGGYGDEESTSTNGSIGKAEGKSLKKKPSWFRMKDLPFFRKHKGSSSPVSASDTTG